MGDTYPKQRDLLRSLSNAPARILSRAGDLGLKKFGVRHPRLCLWGRIDRLPSGHICFLPGAILLLARRRSFARFVQVFDH